jgi:nitroreductase
MGVSAIRVVVITVFLVIGMVLAGVILQPEASVKAWDVKESDFPANGSDKEKLQFLLNYAILAPSSHNSQPWKFNVSEDEIRLYADKTRWLKVADADQRELHISLGCTLENLLVAAEHFGYGYDVTYFPGEEDLVAIVKLAPAQASGGQSSRDPRLFDAILTRHTNRKPYEDKAIPESALKMFQNQSDDDDIQLYLTSDPEAINKFGDLVVRADKIQYGDPNYRSELGYWLGQGVLGPTGIQAKIAQLYVVLLDAGSDQTKKDAELVNSTPVLGFISSRENDRTSQVKVGQLFERVWLAAEAEGIRLHPMSQALEVPELKSELAKMVPENGLYLQQTFRLGYAEPEDGHTPRRPVADVIVEGG